MKKKNGVNHSMELKVIIRRKSVIERLESQLKAGTKMYGKQSELVTSLTDADRSRIQKELETLKGRLTPRK